MSDDILEVEERWATLPEWLLHAPVSPRAKVLYAVLQRFGNTTGVRMPSQQELTDWLHCSEPSVSRASAELEQLGAVRITRTRKPKAVDEPGVFVTRNRYLLRTSDPTVGHVRPRHSPVNDVIHPCTVRRSQVNATEGKELQPPPTPTEEEVPGGIDVPELAAELRVLRRELGRPVGRWTTRAVRRAIVAAVTAGYDPHRCSYALREIAGDRATQTPGRLPHDGPWWDAAEADEIRARRRDALEQERAAVARHRADCPRCDERGLMKTLHGEARCDHIPDEESDTA